MGSFLAEYKIFPSLKLLYQGVSSISNFSFKSISVAMTQFSRMLRLLIQDLNVSESFKNKT